MVGMEFVKITVLMDDATPGTGDLVAQHGASFFLEIGTGEEIRNILVDVGQSSEMLFHNMDRLCLSPEMVDAIVLTHCHYDHTGGLAEVLRATGKKDLPVIAHPTVFRPHFAYKPCLRHIGVPRGNGLKIPSRTIRPSPSTYSGVINILRADGNIEKHHFWSGAGPDGWSPCSHTAADVKQGFLLPEKAPVLFENHIRNDIERKKLPPVGVS